MYPKFLFIPTLIVGLLCLGLPLLPAQSLTLVPDPPPDERTTPDWPAQWRASGVVYDQYDRPVAGAMVSRIDAPGPAVITTAEGRFSLPQIQPGHRLRITKPDYLTTEVTAGELIWFFTDATAARTQVRLPIFDVVLAAGPQGGTFRGALDIDVPAGALDGPVTIRAARLPAGYRSLVGVGPQPQSFGTVHFEPAGLQFRRPIRVGQATATPPAENAAPALVQLLPTPQGAVARPVPEADVRVQNDYWSYSLTHFSEYRLVDENNLVESFEPKLPAEDANMDGVWNEQDAERILRLENGPHDFNYTLRFGQTQSIAETRERTDRTDSETTATASASAGYGGLSLGASVEEQVRRANELAEKFGYDRVVEKVRTGQFELSDAEYTTKCLMVFPNYRFRRFYEYRRARPSAAELAGIRASHAANHQAGEEWTHLRVEGSQSIASERSLYGGQKLAVRKNDSGEIEVFVRRANYTLRTLKGFSSGDCERFTSPPAHRLVYGDYLRVTPEGAESYSLEYRGYRTLTEPEEKHYDKECGASYTGEIASKRSRMAFKEITARQERETTAGQGVSAGLEVPLPGGVTLGGNASLHTQRTQAATASHHFAANTAEADESILQFTIRNEHEEHESDHELYLLYHVYEMRDWRYLMPTDPTVPASLKQRMRAAARTDRTRGQTRDGKLVLLVKEAGKEYWYESGPPVEIVREAGYLLKRVGERPCGVEEPPLRDPRPAETTPDPELPDDQSYRARGTGRTTGHIATITVRNRGDAPLDIAGETFYIPSTHRFQSYVGRIRGPIRVAPGATVPVAVYGYCLDLRRPPVPEGYELRLEDWIPVGGPTTAGRSILPRPPRPAFTTAMIPAIVSSPAFRRRPPAAEQVVVIWPAAEELVPVSVAEAEPVPSIVPSVPQSGDPVGGVIDLDRLPMLTAPLAVAIVNSVERGARKIQANPAIATPFAADPDRELEALIQQTVWRVVASLTGQPYRKGEFAQTVYDQYTANTGRSVTALPAEGKERLDEGVDDFWNAFSAVGLEAKVMQHEPAQTQDK